MDQEIVTHFDLRSANYDRITGWANDEHVTAATLDFLNVRPGCKVLDAGSGTAGVLRDVLQACSGVGLCVALDISQSMLSVTSDLRIRPCVADICAIPFDDGFFDIAVCRQVLHYVALVANAIREIHRVLQPRGALVVGQIVPFDEDDEDYWFRILRFRQPLRKHFLTSHDLLSLLMANGFTVVRVAQMRVRESLLSWLDRYSPCTSEAKEIRRLFVQAPSAFKVKRRLELVDDDVVFDNCFTFIRGIKRD